MACSKSWDTWRLASRAAPVARAWVLLLLLPVLLLLLLLLCGEVRFAVVRFCVLDVGIFICPPKMRQAQPGLARTADRLLSQKRSMRSVDAGYCAIAQFRGWER